MFYYAYGLAKYCSYWPTKYRTPPNSAKFNRINSGWTVHTEPNDRQYQAAHCEQYRLNAADSCSAIALLQYIHMYIIPRSVTKRGTTHPFETNGEL